ncbi:MAG: Unknown protein [uncultured Campylobacterales bacterium]|uniref:Uncharacterized protein n=1 Tax=uncultured Campylobacterales bacterium TaxID=352960 RepID=A0A6S6SWQ9_9BACT|nr:MAG: Unknown protein [uncultured Campylobacterales bacterium]
MNESLQSQLTQELNKIKMIWGALLFSVFIYLTISFVLTKIDSGLNFDPSILQINFLGISVLLWAYILGLALFLLGYYMINYLQKRSFKTIEEQSQTLDEKKLAFILKENTKNTFILFAIFELITIIGLILFMKSGYLNIVIHLSILTIIGALLIWPSENKILKNII